MYIYQNLSQVDILAKDKKYKVDETIMFLIIIIFIIIQLKRKMAWLFSYSYIMKLHIIFNFHAFYVINIRLKWEEIIDIIK